MEKYRKLQPQIDLINHIVGDEDTPWDAKIKAIDTLPYLLGSPPKDGISLSRHMGLDKIAEQMVKTGETAAKPGTPGKTGETIQAPTGGGEVSPYDLRVPSFAGDAPSNISAQDAGLLSTS